MNSRTLLAVLLTASVDTVNAFFRISCTNIQFGRIDPVVNPGTISAHAHTIVGASNIGVNSTYASLSQSECNSCEIMSDNSAYWTPMMYYQHSNGSFEEVPHSSSVVYYLGRGFLPDGSQTYTPFPEGFRMLSGNKAVRAYNQTGVTWGNATYPSQPIQDAVTFLCLAAAVGDNVVNMDQSSVPTCFNGYRTQIHFQTCWNGVDLYKSDNSHVAYLSGIDNGVCPPGYPKLLPHLFMETDYAVNQVSNYNTDGGQYVFSMGDPTGYGFHADFINGWNMTIQEQAVTECLGPEGFGTIEECAVLNAVRQEETGLNCPVQPEPIGEQVRGMIAKLPGCVNITPGPQAATATDLECPAGYPQPSITRTIDSTPLATMDPAIGSLYGLANQLYVGCGNDSVGPPPRTLNAVYTFSVNMSVEYCQAYCNASGYRYSGVEYQYQCYCDNYIDPSVTFYGGVNMSVGCNILCNGDRNEFCGGAGYINVFNNTDPSFVPTNDTTNSNYQLTVPVAVFNTTYQGCALDNPTTRALNGSAFNSVNMTVDLCTAFCAAGNYRYAGLEYASQCFCGDALASGSYYLDTTTNFTQSSCNLRCGGNYSEICGASNALSVYVNPGYIPIEIVGNVAHYFSKGCLTDPIGVGGRALAAATLVDETGMDVEMCLGYCAQGGYRYAGLEYASQCFCDYEIQSISQASVVECPFGGDLMVCPGNAYQYCGAGQLLNLYYSNVPVVAASVVM